MTLDFDITGVSGTIQALNQLGGTLAQQGYETGLLEAAKVIVKEARRTTLHGDKTGLLRSSWLARRGLPRYTPSAVVTNTAPHAHLVLIGTKPRWQTKTSRFVGRIEPGSRPVVERAGAAAAQEALAAFNRGVDSEGAKIQQELTRGTRIRARTLRNIGL